MTFQPRVYNPDFLHHLRQAFNGSRAQFHLDISVCRRIHELKLHKRRRRGCRAGKRVRKYRFLNVECNEPKDNVANCNSANLITIDVRKGPIFTNNNTWSLRGCLWNCQSLRHKDFTLKMVLEERDIDFCVLLETWIKSQTAEDLAWISSSILNRDGYKLRMKSRDGPKGGGRMALVSKDTISVKEVYPLKRQSFESMVWKLTIGNNQLLLWVIYHPPSKRPGLSPSSFTEELLDAMETDILYERNVLLLGDFNLHMDDN